MGVFRPPPEMVAALLGIWKAGGAYIPLDPATPIQRIALILEDSPLLLCSLAMRRGRLPSTTVQVIHFEDFWAARRPALGLPTPACDMASADSLDYVIYTSGSTGQPKGVCISHGQSRYH